MVFGDSLCRQLLDSQGVGLERKSLGKCSKDLSGATALVNLAGR